MRPVMSGVAMITRGLQEFDAASESEKTVAAVHWLAHMTRQLRKDDILSLNVMYLNAKERMHEVREMLWAIPRGHPVFMQSWKEAVLAKEHCVDKISWMDDYAGLEEMSLLRDMWLARTPDDRLNALLLLAARTPAQRDSINRSCDSFVRLAAWDAAAENLMTSDAVFAATKLTIDLYRGYHRTESRPAHQALADAIMIFLARCQDGPGAYQSHSDMDADAAKALIIAYPALCSQVLLHVWETDGFRFRDAVIGTTPGLPEGGEKKLEALCSWFPGQVDAIDLAEHMGLSCRDTLANLYGALNGAQGVAELPPEISASV